jgi:type I restriction enzyme S subunit
MYKQITVRLWGKGVVLRNEVPGTKIRAKRRYVAREGQFILSRIDARNGAFGIVSDFLDGGAVTNDFPVFNMDESRLFPPFLEWMSKTRRFVRLCKRASEGTTNRVRIQLDRFLTSTVPLPALDEQRYIVERIEELAGKVEAAQELRQEAVEMLENLRASTSKQLFSGKHDWPCFSIEDCCETIIDYRGRTPPMSRDGIPHLTSANVREGYIDWTTDRFVSEETYEAYMTRGIPQAGDVLFTMEAPLGNVAVLPDNRCFSLAQRLIILRPKIDLVSSDYLARALMSPDVRREIFANATGTTVKGIAAKRLKPIDLPVPPPSKQHKLVACLDSLQARVDEILERQASTAEALDALLPSVLDKAFKGKL